MLELGLKTLIAYLLGSVMGGLIAGSRRGVDIREQGSGNLGGTNALRTQGFWFAFATVVVDVAKGWLAAGWLPGADLPGVAADPTIGREWLAASCAAAAVAGHVWPLYHEFRGGKGGATLIGALLALAPATVPVALGAWLLVAMLSGYAGLATMLAAASVPIAAQLFHPGARGLLALSLAMAAFIVWTHRSNIARMRAGKEARLGRLWLLGPRTPRT
ncbi:MAG: glycerol-3-phosphate 1-O-acyltransferase PlsY [Steroidobacteraceae bacterium]|nr:glycerol-3-phosphate 1-O-acyltransferase PlsY [Steroidobacteraceae bacterium]